MIDEIKGIEIDGRRFSPKQTLEFFKPTKQGNFPQRLAIVYGRNGSGKTTLASAFRQTDHIWADTRLKVALIKNDDSRIPLPVEGNAPKPIVHVFDEKYVDSKIKLRPDKSGLGSIVLFSNIDDIDTAISTLETQKEQASTTAKNLRDEINKLSDANKPNAPSYIWNNIKQLLKERWAEEDRQIRGNITKSRVSDDTVGHIAQLACKTPENTIKSEYAQTQSRLDALNKVEDIGNCPELHQFKNDPFFEQSLLTLLNQKVEKPNLSEREKRILSVISQHPGRIDEIHAVFSSEIDYCPYCFRTINANEKTEALHCIEHVLNQAVKDYKTKLTAIKLPEFSFNKLPYASIDAQLTSEIDSLTAKLQEIVNDYQADVKNKCNNVFQETTFSSRLLTETLSETNARILQLENIRTNLVALSKKKNDLKNDLLRLCQEKAHYQVAPIYQTYLTQNKLLKSKEENLSKINTKLEDITKEIDNLKAQKRGTKLAVDYINASLRYIYASQHRFEIEPKDENYILKSSGHDILPSDVSTGERHALALAYFFVDIMSNHASKDFYKDEMLLVIDDPVSSFDTENKIGVFSLLIREFRNILTGNSKSRIILFTHDIHTMIQICKAGNTLFKDILGGKPSQLQPLQLEATGQFAPFNPDNHNEYSALLWDIYDYAKNGTYHSCVFSIGNEMRRVLEAYSTFLYRKDFLALFYDKVIGQRLGILSNYFASRMDRIVLHGESHMQYQAQAITSTGDFFAELSDTDKHQTAKDILCLLYLLDKEHLLSHLDHEKLHPAKDVEQKILSWKADIEQSLLPDTAIKDMPTTGTSL